MKKIAGLFVLMLMMSFSAYSQKIAFVTDYTSSGRAVETGTSWIIKSSGGYVTMLYNQSSKFPSVGNMWVYVDILEDGTYKPYKTTEITGNKFQNWFAFGIWVDKPGSFKVTVKDLTDDLASATMSVKVKGENSNTSNNYSNNSGDYSSSKVIFCEDVTDDGEPSYADNVFNIAPEGSYVQVLVKNGGKKLNTTAFNVKVYKMKKGDYQYVETKSITGIENSWVYAYFKYSFFDTGDFKFVVYNADNNLINTGYVTIKYK